MTMFDFWQFLFGIMGYYLILIVFYDIVTVPLVDRDTQIMYVSMYVCMNV